MFNGLITHVKPSTPWQVCAICKETLSILTYAKSTITYNLKKGCH